MPPKRRKITSKAQWGFLFSTNPKVAKRMADATIGGTKRGTKKGKKAYAGLPKKRKKNKRSK